MRWTRVVERCGALVGLVAVAGLAAACGGVASEGPADGSTADAVSAKPAHDSGARDAGHADATPVDSGKAKDAAVEAADGGKADAETDGAADAARDHGGVSSIYPAFTPDVPQVQNNGGVVLTSPEIVTITWPGEANAAALEAFGDDIGRGPYWAATTKEYGVGPATSGPANHVRLAEQPIAQWSDSALAAWLADHATNYAKYGLPAPTPQTIYTLYLSTSTSLTVSGTDGCQQGVGGYHETFVLGGAQIPYAVVLQCRGAQLNDATSSASHELIEAATDPQATNSPAYIYFDGDHLAWDVFQQFQDEVGDACEFYFGPTGSFYMQPFSVVEEADAGADGGDAGLVPDAGTVSYNVQRTWSNLAAAAGHNPCVPAVTGPYASVTPLGMETVTMNLTGIGGSASAKSLGYRILKGETRTFAVGFHSDGPTGGPWTISAREGNPLMGGVSSPHITTTIDTPSGQNGDIAYVTVTVEAVDTTMDGELLTIVSQLSTGGRAFLPILISNQ